ncbi:MAG: SPOR domain-containing protein [Candidatus Omnitrophota bacterium]|nr:SPOR domain-containing protein [Candidatus Omnitrophota bacterium]
MQKAVNIRKFLVLSLCLASCVLRLAFAADLGTMKAFLLDGDYKAAINEGEKILAVGGQASGTDELYYFLGLSYLKDGNYLRASDIFEIVLKEFPRGEFQGGAKLGLGDAYFLRQDFVRAESYYQEILSSAPADGLKGQAIYQLAQISFKKGDAQAGNKYLIRLKKEFPGHQELSSDGLVPEPAAGYTVQLGAFSSLINANNLKAQLIAKGYPAYVEEFTSQGKLAYRVRVGKSARQEEILELEHRLAQDGYPTKIFP